MTRNGVPVDRGQHRSAARRSPATVPPTRPTTRTRASSWRPRPRPARARRSSPWQRATRKPAPAQEARTLVNNPTSPAQAPQKEVRNASALQGQRVFLTICIPLGSVERFSPKKTFEPLPLPCDPFTICLPGYSQPQKQEDASNLSFTYVEAKEGKKFCLRLQVKTEKRTFHKI